MHLYLVRGIPGSGKSTIAGIIAQATDAKHLETDRFFDTPDGYIFDASKLKEAHQWCYDTCAYYISTGRPVVVSNTFTTKKELQPYLDLAKKWNILFTVVDMHHSFQSIHNVPASNIKRMLDRWEHTRDIINPNYERNINHAASMERIVAGNVTTAEMETPKGEK